MTSAPAESWTTSPATGPSLSFGPGHVLEDGHLAAGGARRGADPLDRLGVLVGAAVREVEPGDVHPGLDHPPEDLRLARGGADRRHDLGRTDGAHDGGGYPREWSPEKKAALSA